MLFYKGFLEFFVEFDFFRNCFLFCVIVDVFWVFDGFLVLFIDYGIWYFFYLVLYFFDFWLFLLFLWFGFLLGIEFVVYLLFFSIDFVNFLFKFV